MSVNAKLDAIQARVDGIGARFDTIRSDADVLTALYNKAMEAEAITGIQTASVELPSGHTVYLTLGGTSQGRSVNRRKHFRKEWNVKYPGDKYSKRASEETVRSLVQG